MSCRSCRWIIGCSAFVAASATMAFAGPPQKETGTIFDRAEKRADQLGDQLGVEGDQIDAVHDRDRQEASSPNRPPKLPTDFERLELNEPERAAMFRVIGQYDDRIATILDRFRKRHAEAIGLEAIAVAAKMDRNGDTKLADSPESTTREGRRTAGFRPGDATAGSESKPDEAIKRITAESPFAGPAAETWKELHGLHLQAVELEAQKLIALERELPKEKLDQLHEFRARSHRDHVTEKAPARPDRPDLRNTGKHPEEERRDRERDRRAGARGVEGRDDLPQTDSNRVPEPRVDE